MGEMSANSRTDAFQGLVHVYSAKATRKLKVFDNRKDIALNDNLGGDASFCKELLDYRRNLFDKK
jgi:hypothetical protein